MSIRLVHSVWPMIGRHRGAVEIVEAELDNSVNVAAVRMANEQP
jgi:hypothetical protein